MFTTLTEMLGKEAAQRFLTVAQTQLQQYQYDLQAGLQQQDWHTAAIIAHKLSATAHLYDSSTLPDLLALISSQNTEVLQQANFIDKLNQEFQQITSNIYLFIDDYP
ncbi:MAG: hypothetical protein QJT81_19935 [Candidatus Thiothrix putei]|uniref:Hpt domain-containing protein n=2 Tax=Thiothrix TaxID=1030 RepID=A0A1H3Z3N2_9GAMM|nr:hypothetical protein [Thiothrix caldifontis]WGZ94031.1 MAG: hypothetical protein QJT81_19935 [Candidatus Thiothrix putei]SEA18266.1 hypothetical protein SAMN05660964_01044 [Thiothrix caldifontis]